LGRHDPHQNLENYDQHCAISPNFKTTKSSAANKKSLVGKKKMAGSLFKNMPQPLVLQPRGIPRALCIHGREEDIAAGSQR